MTDYAVVNFGKVYLVDDKPLDTIDKGEHKNQELKQHNLKVLICKVYFWFQEKFNFSKILEL